MSVFVAKELEQILRHWEDLVIYGELLYQNSLKNKQSREVMDQKLFPMIGSEISEGGFLAKSLEGFNNLRKVMAGAPHTHRTNWLPRVPKDWRQYFEDSYEFTMNYRQVKSVCKIPEFLLQWNENRKACIIEEGVYVPRIDLRRENWLDDLPYSSFFLKFEEKNFVMMTDDGKKWDFSNFLVVEDDALIRVFAWPREFDQMVMTDADRQEMIKTISRLKKGSPIKQKIEERVSKNRNFTYVTINLVKSTGKLQYLLGMPPEYQYVDFYDEQELAKNFSKIDNSFSYVKDALELLNGFCKLMHHLPKADIVKSLGGESSHEAFRKRPNQWFELPLQIVDQVRAKDAKRIVYRNGHGSAKSYHKRKKHLRRITRKDGSKDVIWVRAAEIRPDKAIEEQLQGGATKVVGKIKVLC